jgi:hypothetical protein
MIIESDKEYFYLELIFVWLNLLIYFLKVDA